MKYKYGISIRLICDLKTLWSRLLNLVLNNDTYIIGHEYKLTQEATIDDPREILTCRVCGAESIGYYGD